MAKFCITIDQGNSHTKYALFSLANKELLHFTDRPESIFEKFRPDTTNTIITKSSVTTSRPVPKLFNTYNVFDVSDFIHTDQFLDMPIHYTNTVGSDRIIVGHYAFQKGPPALVIDSGSFTTVDYIDKKGFQGGSILPGIELIKDSYLKGEALASTAKKLKERDLMNFSPSSPSQPQTTQDAIINGILLSFMTPIEYLIQDSPAQVIYLTGGGSQLLSSYLKKENRHIQLVPYLLHSSLADLAELIEEKGLTR